MIETGSIKEALIEAVIIKAGIIKRAVQSVTNDAFELTIETTESNETFLLPMRSVTSIDIDWGDGTVDTGITSDNPTHVYATADTYAISVTGTAGTVLFFGSGSESKLKTVTNLGALGWTSFNSSFRNCSSMTSFDAGDCDTSSVTSMFRTFYSCSSLTTLNVSSFNTSFVTNIGAMFNNCTSLTTLDLSSFDTSSVKNVTTMFLSCSSLTDIVGVEDFNIEGLNATFSLDNFAFGVTLPTARYDQLLINWDAQEPFDNMTPNFGNSQYTAGGAAEAARTSLRDGDGWTITDGGSV